MPKFNKRHYEAIALVMQELNTGDDTGTIDYDPRTEMLEDTINAFARMLAADNPQFDRGRFVFACKPGHNVKAKTAHLKVCQ